jgi:hypothetical protein
VSGSGTLGEAKMCTFTLESAHFTFKKCPIYTHDGASAKFSTNSHETDYSVRSGTGWIVNDEESDDVTMRILCVSGT